VHKAELLRDLDLVFPWLHGGKKMKNTKNPLVMFVILWSTYKKLLKIAIEIVMLVYQRVQFAIEHIAISESLT